MCSLNLFSLLRSRFETAGTFMIIIVSVVILSLENNVDSTFSLPLENNVDSTSSLPLENNVDSTSSLPV